MAARDAQTIRRIGEVNLRDIRTRSARTISALMAISALLYWWSLLSDSNPSFAAVMLTLALLIVFASSYLWSDSRPRVAAVLLIGGSLAVAHAAFAFLPLAAAVPLLLLPGVAAYGVVGPGAGLAATLLAVLMSSVSLGSSSALISAGLLLVMMTFLAVLSPRASVLDWSWQRSAEAIDLAEQLRDRQGELNRVLSALRVAYQLLERTNRELAEAHQEADEARRLKEEFAANVSHELRTPLNIILGFAEIMYRTPGVYGDLTWPGVLRRDISEIWRSARYISELVDDILELARVDALRMPVTREMADLASVVTETAELADRLTEDKAVALIVDVPSDLPPVYLDRTRIRQVLLNLLTNAIRFTDVGTVTVSAVRNQDDVQVTVSDTGVGIAQHELEMVFREFHRAEGPGQRGGKGLGLAIARRFVQLHGGRIWAESRLGQGSQFHFTLPLGPKRVSRLTGGAVSAEPRSHTGPVLVAGHPGDTHAYDYLSRHLDGFELVTTEPGTDPHDLVDRLHPRAVVVEGPPGEVELRAERLADSLPANVTIIATTLYGRTAGCGQSPFDEVLAKPVEPQALTRLVGKYLRGGTVMVVDDDRAFVQLVRRILQAWSPTLAVRWAYDGAEALERLRSSPADLVLVDMVMQPMAGVALAELIRREPGMASTPILAVTGAGGPEADARVSWVRLTKRGGMRESEAVAVLRSLLGSVRSEYVVSGRDVPAPQ